MKFLSRNCFLDKAKIDNAVSVYFYLFLYIYIVQVIWCITHSVRTIILLLLRFSNTNILLLVSHVRSHYL